jgi:glycosyltransferase involved in cell wall biosynthesis
LKVAVVHDWLDTWRGGERVLAEILRVFPDADLFALVDFLSDADRVALGGRRARTSFLQRIPGGSASFRWMLPLFPAAIESLDVSAYDLVVSSSHAVAKGVRTHARQMHVCYCYTPMRYAWDLRDAYLEQTGFRGLRGSVARRVLDRIAAWDKASSTRVDHFVAISRHIAERIRRCYGRESTVIHPPVAVTPIDPPPPRNGTYVTVSQLVPYKRVDLIVDAFRAMPERQLIVVGEGPERAKVAATAPPNVSFVGRVPDGARDRHVAAARAFIFAACEDFGIAPLEAHALGTPVVAYAGGAATETIPGLAAPEPTGVLFAEQSAPAIVDAIRRFEREEPRIRSEACRRNARRFDAARFRREFESFVVAQVASRADAVAAR